LKKRREKNKEKEKAKAKAKAKEKEKEKEKTLTQRTQRSEHRVHGEEKSGSQAEACATCGGNGGGEVKLQI